MLTPGRPLPHARRTLQPTEPITASALAAAPPEQQKQMLGERLFPPIEAQEPALAGKITGMLLEMDNGELLNLLESPEALNAKIKEAKAVLQVRARRTSGPSRCPRTADEACPAAAAAQVHQQTTEEGSEVPAQ